jgi:methionyl-tRNA formyltransferase
MERQGNMSNKARIVFMGTPEFAVGTLDALLEDGNEVVGVITAPDRPAGRGQQPKSSAVKIYADEKGLKVLQPEKLRNPEFLAELKALEADLFIVVAFRMLPEVVWAMAPKGTVNLHASLLPQYRGAAPINWAIINGESETGVTTFFIQQEIDTGPLIHQAKVEIDEQMNAGQLHDALKEVGAKLMCETVSEIMTEANPSVDQVQAVELKSAPKIFKPDCKIDWNKSVKQIHNHIRGLSPYPAAFSELIQEGKSYPFKAFRSTYIYKDMSGEEFGAVKVDDERLAVNATDGVLYLTEIQLSGKKRMPVSAFLKGFRLPEGAKVST